MCRWACACASASACEGACACGSVCVSVCACVYVCVRVCVCVCVRVHSRARRFVFIKEDYQQYYTNIFSHLCVSLSMCDVVSVRVHVSEGSQHSSQHLDPENNADSNRLSAHQPMALAREGTEGGLHHDDSTQQDTLHDADQDSADRSADLPRSPLPSARDRVGEFVEGTGTCVAEEEARVAASFASVEAGGGVRHANSRSTPQPFTLAATNYLPAGAGSRVRGTGDHEVGAAKGAHLVIERGLSCLCRKEGCGGPIWGFSWEKQAAIGDLPDSVSDAKKEFSSRMARVRKFNKQHNDKPSSSQPLAQEIQKYDLYEYFYSDWGQSEELLPNCFSDPAAAQSEFYREVDCFNSLHKVQFKVCTNSNTWQIVSLKDKRVYVVGVDAWQSESQARKLFRIFVKGKIVKPKVSVVLAPPHECAVGAAGGVAAVTAKRANVESEVISEDETEASKRARGGVVHRRAVASSLLGSMAAAGGSDDNQGPSENLSGVKTGVTQGVVAGRVAANDPSCSEFQAYFNPSRSVFQAYFNNVLTILTGWSWSTHLLVLHIEDIIMGGTLPALNTMLSGELKAEVGAASSHSEVAATRLRLKNALIEIGLHTVRAVDSNENVEITSVSDAINVQVGRLIKDGIVVQEVEAAQYARNLALRNWASVMEKTACAASVMEKTACDEFFLDQVDDFFKSFLIRQLAPCQIVKAKSFLLTMEFAGPSRWFAPVVLSCIQRNSGVKDQLRALNWRCVCVKACADMRNCVKIQYK